MKSLSKLLTLSRIIVLILLLALSVSIISCADNNSQDENKTAGDIPSNGDNSADPLKEELKSPVPDNLKFDGYKVRFLVYYPEYGADGSLDPARATITRAEEAAGDVVFEAIYKRNIEVQEKFNVTFDFTYLPTGADGDTYSNQTISTSVRSNSDDFDIVLGMQFQCVQLVTGGVFKNIIDLPYLDITNPWWATQYINDLTIGKDTLLYVTGDISLGWLSRLSTMYFSKDLYAANFDDPDGLYKLVLEGNWTMDAFNNMIKGMYKDLDGDGEASDGDQYGMITHTISPTDHFTYASGFRATARDEDGFPYFVIDSEKTVRFVEKLHEIFFNNAGSFIVPSSHARFNDTGNGNIFTDKFVAKEVLFRPDTLGGSEALRNMETDFGMIPFPKLDLNEPTYLALVHDTAPLMCVPTTSSNNELVGAILEEMAYKGYVHMTPSYFDVALKAKYMRDSDDVAMQCVDIIRENSISDFAYIYNYALKKDRSTFTNHIGLIVRDIMGARSSNFASYWDRVSGVAEANLQKLIEAYMG